MKVVVTGGGGFIGGHLVKALLADGHEVRSVDVKPIEDWWQVHDGADNRAKANCMELAVCREVTDGVDEVFNLAADMGGMGFIENNKAACMLSVLISTHMLQAARENGVGRFFYSSSACVYAADHQTDTDVTALARVRCLPGDARGRVRLGEAVLRADGTPLP